MFIYLCICVGVHYMYIFFWFFCFCYWTVEMIRSAGSFTHRMIKRQLRSMMLNCSWLQLMTRVWESASRPHSSIWIWLRTLPQVLWGSSVPFGIHRLSVTAANCNIPMIWISSRELLYLSPSSLSLYYSYILCFFLFSRIRNEWMDWTDFCCLLCYRDAVRRRKRLRRGTSHRRITIRN